jgi:hypothetical protein
MVSVVCQWDFYEQIQKLIRLLLYTSYKRARKFQALVHLYPVSKRWVKDHLVIILVTVRLSLNFILGVNIYILDREDRVSGETVVTVSIAVSKSTDRGKMIQEQRESK